METIPTTVNPGGGEPWGPPGATVAVIGAGYVGLATAVCLAHRGHRVSCAEVDLGKLALLSQGIPTIVEEGLAELLREGLGSGRLTFTGDPGRAVRSADFVFLCVPTPSRPDGSADVTALEQAARAVGPHLTSSAVVVNKSTVPIGSTALVERLLERDDVSVVSNPEFLREGSAIHDSLHPSRIVVGGDDPNAASRVATLLGCASAPVIITNAPTAEMIKYASNAFLATKLSFVNQVASVCEALGANVADVLRGLGHDRRIGFDYLEPGPGWGGSCLPKDTKALAFMAKEAGFDFSLLEEVIRSNDAHMASIVHKVRVSAGGSLAGRRVGAWGLTFKAGTDDRRGSPALAVLRGVLAEGGTVRAFDPTTVGQDVPELTGPITICDDPYAACEGAEVLVVLTEWEEFRSVDLTKVHDIMAKPRIVDARNLFDPVVLGDLGFGYLGIGRR